MKKNDKLNHDKEHKVNDKMEIYTIMYKMTNSTLKQRQ